MIQGYFTGSGTILGRSESTTEHLVKIFKQIRQYVSYYKTENT